MGCQKFEMMTTYPWPLTFWTQNQQASTDCRGLLLCQVSSHSDQRFLSYRANIHTHIQTHIVTKWSLYPRRRRSTAARTANRFSTRTDVGSHVSISRVTACRQMDTAPSTVCIQLGDVTDGSLTAVWLWISLSTDRQNTVRQTTQLYYE